MRRSFAISSVVHIAFLILVVSSGFQGTRHRTVDVMNVRLVGTERKQEPKAEVKAVTPPKTQPQPEKKVEKPKMTYKSKTKTRETRKEVKPVKQEPKQPEQAETNATDPKPAADEDETEDSRPPAGSTSNVRVDDEDFRFAYYLEIIKERVSFNWSPPPVSGGREVMCTVIVERIK